MSTEAELVGALCPKPEKTLSFAEQQRGLAGFLCLFLEMRQLCFEPEEMGVGAPISAAWKP